MKYVKLGATGLKVSQVCLGAMTFGSKFYNIGTVGEDLAYEMVKRSYDSGVNFFDTADAYSFGESEIILGKAIKKLGIERSKLVIATKVRSAMSKEAMTGTGDFNNVGLSRKHIIESCDNSLKRLGMDYIDLYQIHGWDILTGIEEAIEALNDLVRKGKVLYIGVSNWSARHIAKALYISKARGLASFVSLQAYYSLIGRDVEHELLPLCNEEGLGFLAWSPLSGGFLTGKYTRENQKPKNARRTEFNFPPIDEARCFDAIDLLGKIAKEKNASIAGIALAWLLHQKGVTSVIIGANKMEQLEQNLGCTDISLTADELNALNNVTKPSSIYPEWMYERQNTGRL
jgi:aryl-alcohol dehydrogenase-like predicted oxidoreductase